MIGFVTGGTGFLGLNLIEVLVAKGWQVVALFRSEATAQRIRQLFPTVKLVSGDIGDLESLKRAVPQNCDAVFHVAADISTWYRWNERQTAINVQGTANVVEACLANRVKRLVHTSTWSVWESEHHPVHVTDEASAPMLGRDGFRNYARTKIQAEDEVRKGIARGLDAVIMNPSHIVGKYDTHGWAQMIKLINANSLPGVGPANGNFANVEAVAEAHVAAATKGRTGENYLLGGPHHSFVDYAQIIAKVLGDKKAPSFALPGFVLKAYAFCSEQYSHWVSGVEPKVSWEKYYIMTCLMNGSSAKAVRELGYRDDVPLELSVQQSVDYLRSINDI
eukprot:TRINITY_DN1985_c0_g1_i1.p1 TRINITY_DN1985_c0_g1~~TRINITY_DN1985_c0_g1_i1.p1  ORF type:complete len:346 (-),score=85.66 TRINITY_DN1985_c0_g1_i1:121-1122(-)